MTVIQGTEGKTRIIFENYLTELGLSCSKWDVQWQHFGYSSLTRIQTLVCYIKNMKS